MFNSILLTKIVKILFDVYRIKTLGDSFLKYIVVELLCFIFSSEDVKDLVKRKDAIVSQDNLKKLGLQRQLERKIINTTFDAKNKNWLPPCYYVSKTLGIYPKNFNFNIFFNLYILNFVYLINH